MGVMGVNRGFGLSRDMAIESLTRLNISVGTSGDSTAYESNENMVNYTGIILNVSSAFTRGGAGLSGVATSSTSFA